MNKTILASAFLWAFFFVNGIFAQQEPSLFKVDNEDVSLAEFKYIYEKNNGSKATFSRPSLEDYLTLYTNFKLKVHKAKEMKLDEDATLKRELEGYRQQLSNSYLTDKEIVEKLVREAYQRSKKDIHISHILIKIANQVSAEEDQKSFNRASDLKSKATVQNFAQLAKDNSDDPSAKTNSGDVGFFPVFQLPYDMETAIYNATENTIIGPVKTQFGYHVIWVQGSRPARGQVNAAHLLLRTKAGEDAANQAAATKIQDLYKQLQAGAKFEDLVKANSEDNSTKDKEGLLGWFGINRYDQVFEGAAFGLTKDGEYSKPIQTSAGWHIIKRIKALVNPTFEETKSELTTKTKKDARFQLVQKSLVEKIKRENNFNVNDNVKKDLLKTLPKEFITFNWKAPDTIPNKDAVLYQLGTKTVSVGEFMDFCAKNPVERSQPIKGAVDPIAGALDAVIEKSVAQTCMDYEQKNLDKKYPEYRFLMHEYEEGILLFEATKKLVWDKASSDEDGLTAFHAKNQNKYKWSDRVKISTYTIRSTDKKLVESIRKMAGKKSPEAVLEKFNKEEKVVSFESSTIEKGKNTEIDALGFKKGKMTTNKEKDGSTSFVKIEEVAPSSNKTLAEARGYVVADYQDFLEKQWIEELRKSYKVDINKNVFDSLIKK